MRKENVDIREEYEHNKVPDDMSAAVSVIVCMYIEAPLYDSFLMACTTYSLLAM